MTRSEFLERFAKHYYAQLPALAAELAGMKVELIVSATTPVSRAVQKCMGYFTAR